MDEPTSPGAAPVDEWWRDVAEASSDGVLVTGPDGRIVLVNDHLLGLSGHRRADLVGGHVDELVAWPYRDRHVRLAVQPGDPTPEHTSDATLRRVDGSLIPVAVRLERRAGDGWGMTTATVTQARPRVAATVERDRLLQVLDLVPDAVVVTDATTLSVEYANQALAALTGYAPHEVVGGPAELWRPDDDDAPRRGAVDAVPSDGRPSLLTGHVTSRFGEEVPVQLNRRLITEPDGSRHLVVVARDLRGQIEQERVLRTSEAAFRTAFEQAPIGATLLALGADGSRSIVMANREAGEMFGCAVADLIGRDPEEFTLPEDRARDAETTSALARGELTQSSRLKQYRRPDGSTLWAEVRGTRVELPDVPGPLALVHLVDVTERVEEQSRRIRGALVDSCVAEVSTDVLSGVPEREVLARLASQAACIFGAGDAVIVLGNPTRNRFRVVAATGDLAGALLDAEGDLGEAPVLSELLRSGTTLLDGAPPAMPEPWASGVGPVAVASFGSASTTMTGAIAVARRRGAAPFGREDVDLLARLATQSHLAIRAARARSDQQQLALLEDRQRIARDLHDSVTQDLIALGMEISLQLSRTDDPSVADRARGQIAVLDHAVHELRRVIFALGPVRRPPTSTAIRGVVDEASRILGHRPALEVSGPVDELADAVADDVLLVLREALSNVARHANAHRTLVHLQVTSGKVRLVVEDDGDGLGTQQGGGSGLPNILHRAAAREGEATITAPQNGGTRLEWTCPVSSP